LLEKYLDELWTCVESRCGFCRSECPTYNLLKIESVTARGRAALALSILMDICTYSNTLANRVFSCLMCRWCEIRCPINKLTQNIIHHSEVTRAFRAELIERGLVPAKIGEFLENIHKYGNPFKETREKKGKWLKELGIDYFTPNHEFLYYIGCIGSYDLRGQNMAKALAEILLKANISFGCLGADEFCSGGEALMLGESGLFQQLAEENIKKFKELGVKKIVTLCPHCYYTIKNEYPSFGGKFEVLHYTQLLSDILKNGKLKLSKKINAKVTYHDPCFLGRYSGDYESPRQILKSTPGIELVEMERARENSYCCGGGCGNFYTGFINGSQNSPSRARVREAHSTGAEILAVSCPHCMIMLEDAVKTEELENKLLVKDISQIILDAI